MKYLAHCTCMFNQVIAHNNLKNFVTNSCGKGIIDVGSIKAELSLYANALNLSASDNGTQRQSITERLAKRQDIRHNILIVDSHQITASTDTRLRLINDQKHTTLLAFSLQSGKIPWW